MKFKDLKNVLSSRDTYAINFDKKSFMCDYESIDEVAKAYELYDLNVKYIKSYGDDGIYIILIK